MINKKGKKKAFNYILKYISQNYEKFSYNITLNFKILFY